MNIVHTNLIRATRLGISLYGNAYYMLHTSQGDYRTSIDSSCNWDVDNLTPGYKQPSEPVILHLTRAGRVQIIEVPEF